MRITRANIDVYGHFSSRMFDLDPTRITVVYGPNEAGKTTFASFLTSMMFGFSPSNIEQHPYGQIDTPDRKLSGRLEFVSGDKRRCAIFRELKSTPKSRYTSGEGLFGDEDDLRNRSIPVVDHINRRVYKSVYSLSLSEMEQIESRTWDFIQDRLLGGLSMEYLKPARVVIESLEQEAKQFWRPDRRGKPIASEIEATLKQLRESRRSARDIDQRVRDLATAVSKLESSLVELKKERAELKYRQRVANKIRPVRTLTARIDELKTKAGDVSPFAELPSDPLQALREVRTRKTELDDRIMALESSIQEDSSTIRGFKSQHEALRSVDDEIRSWGSRIGRHESSIAELEETNSQIGELLARLKVIGEMTFGKADLREVLIQLSSVNQSALLGDVGLMVDSGANRELERAIKTRVKRNLNTALLVICVGIVCSVVGIMLSNSFAAGAGLMGAILALIFWVLNRGGATQLNKPAHNQQEVIQRINRHVSPLRFDTASLTNRRDLYSLVPDFQQLCDGANEYVRLLSRQRRLTETVEDDKQRLGVLTGRLGTDNHAPPTVLIARMSRDLEDANFRYQSAEKARHRTVSVKKELSRTEIAIESLAERENRLATMLEAYGDGDVQSGAKRIVSKRRAYLHAQQLSETLENDYPDWRELLESNAEPVDSGEGEVVDTEMQLDEVEERLQTVTSNLASAREQIRLLEGSKPASDVEGEIEVARRDLLSAKIERDRRLLLAAILRRSEQKFRDSHQPDVIKKANEYLKIITSGRHTRLVLDDLTGSLRLWSEDDQRYIDVERPLSRGTLDQIYLALRIAVIDHLDRNHEKLPVVMDEVLVNWDAKRRHRAYAILKKLSADRHVLMFTCHQWMVDELTELLDAQVITLA